MAQAAKWKQSLHQARRTLAKSWLRFNSQVTVVGITGSYGKTNTARAIAAVLSQKFKTLQTGLDLDTIYNLPVTLLKLRPWHQRLVLEYGVDHRNEMDFHLSLVKPSIGVVTGINPTHSNPELLGSLKGVIEEKSKLLQALPKDGWAILNWDDEKVRPMAKKTKAQILWYGTDRKKCDFWAEKIKVTLGETTFTLHSDTPVYRTKKIQIKTGLIGRHFVYACLAAAAVGIKSGLSWQEIKKSLAKLKSLKGRVSLEKGPRGSVLINDALRANPASTMAGLQVLTDLPTKGKRVAVLGEMGELGVLAEKGHREVGRKVGKLKVDYLISIGPLQKFVVEEAVRHGMKKENVFWVKDVHQAAKVLKKVLKKGDLFYLKGSLLRHLERILLILKNKKVACHVVFCHNYNQCDVCSELEKKSSPQD